MSVVIGFLTSVSFLGDQEGYLSLVLSVSREVVAVYIVDISVHIQSFKWVGIMKIIRAQIDISFFFT